MSENTQKAWITKYALSTGLREVLATGPSEYGYYHVKEYPYTSFSTRDIFFTFAEAQADAEARRDKKIASLKKQIVKLEKMTFEESMEGGNHEDL